MLAETEWPRETLVAFEVKPELSAVLLDVDLAEIEDFLIRFTALMPGTELTEKAMTQKPYAKTMPATSMAASAWVLHTLPFDNVIVSGFTQRVSKRTGYLEDEYILSCKCTRSQMSSVNFAGIEHIDPVEALGDDPVIRKMSSTIIFQPLTL